MSEVIELNPIVNKLHQSQKEVVMEFLKMQKQNAKNFTGLCLSLPMGFGKTITALTIALTLYKKFVIVCSKTVITSWIAEIEKFFDKDSLKYGTSDGGMSYLNKDSKLYELIDLASQKLGLSKHFCGKNNEVLYRSPADLEGSYLFYFLMLNKIVFFQ